MNINLLEVKLSARIMEDYFSRIGDRASFLETFQEINVRFYEKCGYRVVATEDILGLKGYWMTRE